MSETKPGETMGSSHLASLTKDSETLDKIVAALEKSHKDEAEVLSKRLTNINRAISSLKPGTAPIESYDKVRTAVSTALKEFAQQAKSLSKANEKPKDEPKDDGDQIFTFTATTEAAKELNRDKDAKLIQAVKNAMDNTGGRAGPKIDGVSQPFFHIHVGGNAKYNLLYRGKVILGTIDFHIDKTNSKSEKEAVKDVATRKGTVDMKIEDKVILKA